MGWLARLRRRDRFHRLHRLDRWHRLRRLRGSDRRELDRAFGLIALALHDEREPLAVFLLREQFGNAATGVDCGAIHAKEHVARLDAGASGRRTWLHARDDHAAILIGERATKAWTRGLLAGLLRLLGRARRRAVLARGLARRGLRWHPRAFGLGAERHVQRALLVVAHHANRDRLARVRRAKSREQRCDIGRRGLVDREDHVAGLHACLLGGRTRNELAHARRVVLGVEVDAEPAVLEGGDRSQQGQQGCGECVHRRFLRGFACDPGADRNRHRRPVGLIENGAQRPMPRKIPGPCTRLLTDPSSVPRKFAPKPPSSSGLGSVVLSHVTGVQIP